MKLCAGHAAEGETTVGISVNANHTKASKIGTLINIEAEIVEIDGRKITLDITASDEDNNPIGNARHERFIVNSQRFMAKLK